ncbi:hypothetical protein GCM10007874_20810 [Labrys miyagiensis]|uniref:Uncharacterized protein n=1 Tax=Labrys miyagiensis TaxID=346912 RepID=A0ABQ6CK13_9HYPH|nr:hypothetical protein GCM10007874_20810 [Labrys miyagiensis]
MAQRFEKGGPFERNLHGKRPGIANRRSGRCPTYGGKRAKTMQFAVGKGKRSGAFFRVILNMSDLDPVKVPGTVQHTFDDNLS